MMETIVTLVCVLSGTLLLTILLIYISKYMQLRVNLAHAEKMKSLEWECKKDWERFLNARTDELEKRASEGWIKEKESFQKLLKELQAKKDSAYPLDIDRIIVLYLLLAARKGSMSPKDLEEEVENLKKSKELIENYLKG